MLDDSTLNAHLERLRTTPRPLELVRPCTLGDGIAPLEGATPTSADAPTALQFVPASGAATRMFGSLRAVDHADLDTLARATTTAPHLTPAHTALSRWSELALARALPGAAPSHDLPGALQALADSGWADRPKGLVPFHVHGDTWRCAVEAHLRDAAERPSPRVHFTAPTDHLDAFHAVIHDVVERLHAERGIRVQVSTSTQHPETDTPAIDADGALITNAQGQPLLRPGGHGALLRNLNALHGIVRIRNIDNIAHADHRPSLSPWGDALVQAAFDLRDRRDALLRSLRTHTDAQTLSSARAWLMDFGYRPGPDRDDLLQALDRPVRICGVVPNDGQPGGGPFWVRHADGTVTAQIVEGVEVDRTNAEQRAIWEASTHFNPVDLVCVLHNADGEPYELFDFVDDTRWIRTRKRHGGVDARCLERPGLWNGSMSGWLTRFVALPRETFNPVKTVADLLGPMHRPA